MPEINCSGCDVSIPESGVLSHLQEVHLGPSPFELLKVACASCSFKVSTEKLPVMLNHCHITKHDPSKVFLLDGALLMEAEKARTRKVLSDAISLLDVDEKHLDEIHTELATTLVDDSSAHIFDIDTPLAISAATEPEDNSNSEPAGSQQILDENERTLTSTEESTITSTPGGFLYPTPPTSKKITDYAGKTPLDVESKISRKHTCQICGKLMSFGTVYLVRHILGHEDLKVFECSDCGMQANQRYNVKSHCKKRKCRGEVVSIASQATKDLIVEKLGIAFPTADWERLLENGIPGLK